ncbi:MAG: LPS export ABC transporter periplasmic protein LptC [Treponema sp.]|nr:LPS export ABC transporter periplasmic protein LptC [Treponema sp.]
MKGPKREGMLRFHSAQLPGLIAAALVLVSCSFDYGEGTEENDNRPDIMMEEIDYVRVRGGEVQARLQAEYAERWENLQIMDLYSFTFEQLEENGERVNALGHAAQAMVMLDTGDIDLFGGVTVNIESEDIIISTNRLEWRDQARTLRAGDQELVEVERSDGTHFSGEGFFADIRSRTWYFSGPVEGTFVDEDEEEDEAPAEDDSPAENGGGN